MLKRIQNRKRRFVVCVIGVAALAALVTGSIVASSMAAPVNTKSPSISGSPIVGKDLTGDRGTWTGAGITYTNRWMRCDQNASNCAAINGATGTHYTLTSTDFGATIRFEVTAKSGTDSTVANSAPTAEITNGTGVPASSSPPTIAGAATVGTTLTAGNGSWVGDQPITFSYQWLRCDTNGNACKSIGGATHATYKLVQHDVTFTIRIKVTAKNSRGKSSANSTQTAVVTDTSGGGGGGIINLPGGGKSIDVVDVPKGERLIVDKVTFSPNPVTTRSHPITVTITVKDTRGYFVRNAFVFLRSTPILTSTPTDAQTAQDGTISYAVTPLSSFPLKTGYSVQFFVKAYRKGDPTLAGVAGSRLVQVATAK